MQTYGLIGFPVKHSLSPLMHNAAFKACGINAQYHLFEIEPEKLQKFLLEDIKVKDIQGKTFSSKDIIGFNVTIPYKLKTYDILVKGLGQNFEDNYVKLTGAVNTVKRTKTDFKCFNTDATGFIKSLKVDLKFKPQGKKALLLGCGGAGRAVIAGLTQKELSLSKVYVYDIDQNTINSARDYLFGLNDADLKNILEFISKDQMPSKIKECSLLVDATGVGLKKEQILPLDKKFLHKDLSVYDLVYNKDTALLQEAKALGIKAVGGLGMLLYQGAAAFKFWTSKEAPIQVMSKALEDR